ncbi:hypothetical protein LTR94_030714, partial [Friedmanniomyces endolithicus]
GAGVEGFPGDARALLARRPPAGGGGDVPQPRDGRDPAPHRRGGAAGLLRRRQCEGGRGCGHQRAEEPGAADRRRPGRLCREGSPRRVRPVPQLDGVRHGAAVVGRAERAADPDDGRTLPAGHLGQGRRAVVAGDRRGDAARLCRPRSVRGGPRFRGRAGRRAAGPRLPEAAIGADLRHEGARPLRAGHSAGRADAHPRHAGRAGR